jgi:hypothetical protein
VSGARRSRRLAVAVGDDNKAQNTDFRNRDMTVEPSRIMLVCAPCPPVRRGVLAHSHCRAETDKIEAMSAGVLDTRRGVRWVPKRRVRLLERMHFHRHIGVMVVRAREIQPLGLINPFSRIASALSNIAREFSGLTPKFRNS